MLVLALMLGLALAGPVEDARAAMDAHGRGRDVAPLVDALAALREAQTAGLAPKDAPTLELAANVAFLIASDGPEKGRGEAIDLGLTALELAARTRDRSPTLGTVVTSYDLVITRELRQAPQHADWPSWFQRGGRALAVGETLRDDGGALLRAQLADQLARFPDQPARQAAGYALVAIEGRQTSLRRVEPLALTLMAEGAFEEAVRLSVAAIDGLGPSVTLRAVAGGALLRMKRPAEAVVHLDAGLAALHPEDASNRRNLLHDRAIAAVQLREESAGDALTAALAADPDDAALRYELGRWHMMRGKAAYDAAAGNTEAKRAASRAHWEAAIPHLEKLLSDPRFGAHAKGGLVVCYAQVGRADDAAALK